MVCFDKKSSLKPTGMYAADVKSRHFRMKNSCGERVLIYFYALLTTDTRSFSKNRILFHFFPG